MFGQPRTGQKPPDMPTRRRKGSTAGSKAVTVFHQERRTPQ